MVLQRISPEQRLQMAMADSYRDFHTKGFDYVCLSRNNDLTVKAYFFSGDSSGRGHDVVVPHDHRYDAATRVLCGEVTNKFFLEIPDQDITKFRVEHRFFKHYFETPLNGGWGFRPAGMTVLVPQSDECHVAGERYVQAYDHIHTLSDVRDGTILLQWQYRDVLPKDTPTFAYTKSEKPPSFAGCYGDFDVDTFISRLGQLEELVPCILQEHGLHHVAGIPFMPPTEKARDVDLKRAWA
jgi:hypothetical protein